MSTHPELVSKKVSNQTTFTSIEEQHICLPFQGWVENKDLIPKTQKRGPPSKSLINIQKRLSRP